jgi:hypothetical protein
MLTKPVKNLFFEIHLKEIIAEFAGIIGLAT